MRIIFLVLISLLLLSCQENEVAPLFESKPLTFIISCGQDTVVSLKNNIKLKVDKNSINCENSTTVKISVWTCFTKQEMIQHGLSTLDENGRILESSGMIKIEFEDENLINQNIPIEALFTYEENIKDNRTFEMNDDGNWVELNQNTLKDDSTIEYYNSYDIITTMNKSGNVIEIDSIMKDDLGNHHDHDHATKIKTEFTYIVKLYRNSWYNVDRFINEGLEIKTPNLTISNFDPNTMHAILLFKNLNSSIKFVPFGKKLILKGSIKKKTMKWPEDEEVTIVAYQRDERGHVIKGKFHETIFSEKENSVSIKLEDMNKEEFEEKTKVL